MENGKTNEIFGVLRELFGVEAKIELNYATELDLLVAIILSAQCTDKRVNLVTEKLFKKYRTVADYANADVKIFESEIHSCGFYRNKTSNIIGMAKAVQELGGKIPADMEALVKLPGVGRKTANVFLAEWHKLPAIAVDTHVARVSRRLGLTKSKNPEVIERDLKQIVDKKDWRRVNIYLVLFGRYYCKAIKPQCEVCKLKKHCLEFK